MALYFLPDLSENSPAMFTKFYISLLFINDFCVFTHKIGPV